MARVFIPCRQAATVASSSNHPVQQVAIRFSPRLVYWLFAAFLLAVAGMTGLWFAGAAQVRDQIAAIGRAAAGDGGIFTVEKLDITGFPFTFETHLAGITLAGRDARGPWEWRAETAVLDLSPWLGRDMRFELAGKHKLRFRAGRAPMEVELTAARAPGELRLGDSGTPHLIRIAPEQIAAREVTTGATLTADKLALELFAHPQARSALTEPSAGLIVNLRGLDLPEHLGKYLGPKLDHLSAEIQVMGEPPFPVDRRALARWREAGGSIELKSLALQWGPAKMDGSGTLTLDAALQPEASFAARMTGFEETADALVNAGLIREQDAQGVKLLLSLMARRSDPGRGAEIRVPITIQERVIYVGPARLTRLPQIRW